MKSLKIIGLLHFLYTIPFYAQNISGSVYELAKEKATNAPKTPVPFANVFWENTTVGTTTTDEGYFKITAPTTYPAKLIVSHIGYQSDTLVIDSYMKSLTITLQPSLQLKTYEISTREKSSFINTVDPLLVETITSKELNKAACCNISESFETNASVDVNITDAVSGTKKIQLLGLDGIYTQMQFENLPLIRGLSSAFGLTHIPGTWVESIQIKKGAGSVVNGYESTTGQINVEFEKPDEADKLFLNLYTNERLRMEANIHAAQQLNDKWSTMTFAHASTQPLEWDNNHDDFLDQPLRTQYNLFNRWKYVGEKHISQFGFNGVYEDLTSGQLTSNDIPNPYSINVDTRKLEVFTKNGLLFPDLPHRSIGILNTFRYHDHQSLYGNKKYDAVQKSGYLNIIYQTIIGNTDHSIKSGGSLVYDHFDKNYNDSLFGRTEIVPGIFTEYAYDAGNKSSIVAGLRVDHHNTFGLFITPRMHYKYNFTKQTAFRISLGRGFRTAHPFIENAAIMASSREIRVLEQLQPEIAWNYGTSFTHRFEAWEKNMDISVDYYFTNFENQVVIDMENSDEVLMYNLDGTSFSHSLQADYSVSVTEAFEVKVAYKWYDIKTTFRGELKEKPLIAKNRALLNLAYFSNFDKWKFDLTLNWFGKSRAPSTADNPIAYQRDDFSKNYALLNAQITHTLKNGMEIYVGSENITNYRQPDPIIAADQPFSSYFDASLIWGPVNGRVTYAGLKFNLK